MIETAEPSRPFTAPSGMIGESSAMKHVYRLIAKVGPTEAPVLITGESGTGKELVASAIHRSSARRGKPLVTMNCGAISESLIESELFGHERGSFTGAQRMHRGVFERAEGGTLFLDEVAEMPFNLQVRLLRVLETGEFRRVGGHDEIRTSVRTIAATNRNPNKAVRSGRLRRDLFYRLQVFPIELPPLRRRGNDVELLALHFLGLMNEAEGRSVELTKDALAALRERRWPGNVRELKNVVRRAFIVSDDRILAEALAPEISPRSTRDSVIEIRLGSRLTDVEQTLILATLEQSGGNKRHAAGVLGISLRTLYNKLQQYERVSILEKRSRP